MYSIKEIKEANKHYDNEKEKLDELLKEVRTINSNIDLTDVKNNLNYEQTKELYKMIRYRSNDEKNKELKEIMEIKKSLEYPEITGIHYYPIIKTIDFITEKEKIELDILIKDANKNRKVLRKIRDLDERVLNFLIDKDIIEKVYIFHCECESDECYDTEITQEQFDTFKDYWERLKIEGGTTKEEDKYMNYGCFETGCWNDGNVEVSSLEEFNQHLRYTDFRIKTKPDLTLDNI